MAATETVPTVKFPTPKTTRKAKAKTAAPATANAVEASMKTWATVGVYFALVVSAILNGYANAQHAPFAAAGWMMGFATPALVLILSKVASLQFKLRRTKLAAFTGFSGGGLLVLSVWHCATAISLLTGSPLALAVPMAVAIDCGLVACEVATVSQMKK